MPASPTPPTVSAALATALTPHITHTFGLMGNGNAHLIDALATHDIPYTAVRHEAGAIAAADAYTRVSGQLALATATYGAGFTNMLTALAEASQARTPMLVVVGEAPTSGTRPWDVDQEMLAAALGVRCYILTAATIERVTQRAAELALRLRRPVVIGLPYDLSNAASASPISAANALAAGPATAAAAVTATPTPAPQEIDMSDPAILAALSASVAGVSTAATTPAAPRTSVPHAPVIASPAATPPAEHIERACVALREAKRPLILAGHGAHLSGCGSQLGQLADTLEAPTASTALARGMFPAQAFDLGVAGGFSHPGAAAIISEADVVVVVGAALNQFTLRFGELFGADTLLIRIDTEPQHTPHSRQPLTQLMLQGDAAATLKAILTTLETHPATAPSGWRNTLLRDGRLGAALSHDSGLAEHPHGVCADGRLDPRSVAERIASGLPENRVVTSDGGHFIAWANMYWPVSSPERMIMVGTAYQTIGLGISTVAGVAAARPDATVVVTTGDGGALMSLADLETAIRTAPSLVIVVWNDAAYGAELHLYGAMGLDTAPMLMPETNFAAVAQGFGAQGVIIRELSDLRALDDWVTGGAVGTLLLDCRISRSVVAEYQREIQRVNGVSLSEEVSGASEVSSPDAAASADDASATTA